MTPLVTCIGSALKEKSGLPLRAKFKILVLEFWAVYWSLVSQLWWKFILSKVVKTRNAPWKHAVASLQALPPSFLSLWLAPPQPTDPEQNIRCGYLEGELTAEAEADHSVPSSTWELHGIQHLLNFSPRDISHLWNEQIPTQPTCDFSRGELERQQTHTKEDTPTLHLWCET